jgi:hypothetical protein
MPEVDSDSLEKSAKSKWFSTRTFTLGLTSSGIVLYGAMLSLPYQEIDKFTSAVAFVKIIGLVVAVLGLARLVLNYLSSPRGESKLIITERQVDPDSQKVTSKRDIVYEGVSGIEAFQILSANQKAKEGGREPLSLAGLEPENCIAYYRTIVDESRARLTKEIAALGRRGNVNLVIGFTTTLFSVAFLAYIVLTAGNVFANLNTLLAHYIPRITVAVFIEVFAFFFLKLYRSALIDIKYYQNELTALASVSIAMEGALSLKDKKSLSDVVAVIAKANPNASNPSGEEAKGPIDVKDVTDLLERFAKVVLSGKSEEVKAAVKA